MSPGAVASLGEEMKCLLQPSCSPAAGGSALGCCPGVFSPSDRRWWKWLFL